MSQVLRPSKSLPYLSNYHGHFRSFSLYYPTDCLSKLPDTSPVVLSHFYFYFYYFYFSRLRCVYPVVSLFSGFFPLVAVASLTEDGHHLKSRGEPQTSSLFSLPHTLSSKVATRSYRSLLFPTKSHTLDLRRYPFLTTNQEIMTCYNGTGRSKDRNRC